MEAALEISFYVLGVVFALGLVMVLVILRDVFFHGRFSVPLTTLRRVPTTALDAAREALVQRKAALGRVGFDQRDGLLYEIRHLEHRISALEDKTYTDQSDYYDAGKQRERVWRDWRTLHEKLRQESIGARRAHRARLDAYRREFRKLSREIEEEFHRCVARDTLTLEELRSQGVLESEILHPPAPKPAAPAATTPEPAEQAPAAPEGGQGEPPPGEQADAPAPEAQPRPRSGKWMSTLTPYPPAQGGLLGQGDLARPEVIKAGRTYVDGTLSMAGLPGGAVEGADFSRSSFAEVECRGVQRFVNCRFVATDLRRIELPRAEGPHLFQDCDLHGASLAQAQLNGVVFRRCNLAGTHWRSARLDRVLFEHCTITGVRWEGVDLSRTVMSEDMQADADLAFAAKPPLRMRPAMASPPDVDLQPPAEPGAPPEPGPAPESAREEER